jgi:hypothetical protein
MALGKVPSDEVWSETPKYSFAIPATPLTYTYTSGDGLAHVEVFQGDKWFMSWWTPCSETEVQHTVQAMERRLQNSKGDIQVLTTQS